MFTKALLYALGSFVSVALAVCAVMFIEPAPDSMLTALVTGIMVICAPVFGVSSILAVAVFLTTPMEHDSDLGYLLAKIAYWSGFFLLPLVMSFYKLASVG